MKILIILLRGCRRELCGQICELDFPQFEETFDDAYQQGTRGGVDEEVRKYRTQRCPHNLVSTPSKDLGGRHFFESAGAAFGRPFPLLQQTLKFAALLFLFLFIFVTPVFAGDYLYEEYEEYEEPREKYLAAAVLVMDVSTGDCSLNSDGSLCCRPPEPGRVLYEYEGRTRFYPASVTKIMTALLVLEHVSDLTEPVLFSEHAVDIPSYASHMWMEAGDSITVLEALYGIMLSSGNETARALAEHVSGNVPDFVALMNRRAAELGAFDTRFVNPCGLPGGGQFVTAYDMALIMKEAIRRPVLVEIIAAPYFVLPESEFREEERTFFNIHRMVRPDRPEYNPWVVGGKTGFTNAAQHTIVTYARRGEHSIIVSVLYGSFPEFYEDTANLMEYAFALLEAEAEAARVNDPEPYDDSYDLAEAEAEIETEEEPELYVYQTVSDIEAAIAASVSLGMAALALIIVWIMKNRRQKTEGRG